MSMRIVSTVVCGIVTAASAARLLVFAQASAPSGVELVSVTPGGFAAGLSGTDGGAARSSGSFMIRNRFAGGGRYVVFESTASGLVCADANQSRDIFLRDRATGVNQIASLTAAGTPANGSSFEPVVTADARFIAFTSEATNLVASDTNAFQDVFVRDLQAGITERVNVSSTGEQANSFSHNADITADGRFVLFDSLANNLVPGDTNGREDVFLRDRLNGSTERVSIDSAAGEGNAASHSGGISADGRFVVFVSGSSNFVQSDVNFADDVFVRDRVLGTTTLVSRSLNGGVPNLSSREPAISADGRYITYASLATDIVTPDTSNGGIYSIYRFDQQTGITVRVSVAPDGSQNDRDARLPSISGGGRYVSFESWSTNLVEGDSNGTWDVFRRDLQLGVTERVGVLSQISSISEDGSIVYFQSAARLVSADINQSSDVYLYGPPASAGSGPGFAFSAASFSVAEHAASATIVVTRTGNVCSAATVDYSTANGSATAGSDYTAASGTVTFAAGETSKSFSVAIADDTLDEPDETVVLTLANPTGGLSLIAPSTAILTILDDDAGNRPPVATDDAPVTAEDSAVQIAALANDTDPDGDTLTVSAFTQPAHGAVTKNTDQTFTYTPAANYNGGDEFQYTADDGQGATASATVRVTVTAVNDPPIAAGDSYATQQDVPLIIGAAMGVLANDSDVDGSALTAAVVTAPTGGTLVLAADGSFSYTPLAGFAGTDQFTYRASDSELAVSNDATVTIVVQRITGPQTSSCRPIVPANIHRVTDSPLCDVMGEPFVVNRRLSVITNDSVPCVNVDTMEATRCTFTTDGGGNPALSRSAKASGHWMQARDGSRYAVVGQPITRDGTVASGNYVVGTIPFADGSVTCLAATSRDAAGSPAPQGTDLTASGFVEVPGGISNFGGGRLQNFANLTVGTSSIPHPDEAELVSVDQLAGVAWYTGRGAALNDTGGGERDQLGVYYGMVWSMHLVTFGGIQVPAAKRPSTRSFPAPAVVNIHSPITWLAVNPYVTIANGPPIDVRPKYQLPPPAAAFTASIGLTTISVDASASTGDIVEYEFDFSWTPEVDAVGTSPTLDRPLLVIGPVSQGTITLRVTARDGQQSSALMRVNFKSRIPKIIGNLQVVGAPK